MRVCACVCALVCVCKLKSVYSVDSPNGCKVGSIPTVGANLNQNIMIKKILIVCILILLLTACALISKGNFVDAFLIAIPVIAALFLIDNDKQIRL